MGQEVSGGDLVTMSDGKTLRLPKVGDRVLVAFPQRAWLCPGDVVTAPSVRDPYFKIGVMVINKYTPFQKLHHVKDVPHTTTGSGYEAAWRWPS